MAGRRAERKGIDYYLKLPYGIELRPYEDGTWFARVVELPGCMTEADSAEEALAAIRDAQRAWIEACLEDGTPVPEPEHVPAFSGQFRVRVPRSLHHELADKARQEGTSLNQLVVSMLSRAAGEPEQAKSAPRHRPIRRKPPAHAEGR
jgi:antitoxin HicB